MGVCGGTTRPTTWRRRMAMVWASVLVSMSLRTTARSASPATSAFALASLSAVGTSFKRTRGWASATVRTKAAKNF